MEAARRLLVEAGVASPAADARALLAHALGTDRLPVPLPERLSARELTRFASAVDRRARREPLQHIVGSTGFRHLTLQVAPGVFVPRPETEMVAQAAIDGAAARAPRPVVVDLCCGAGGIALSVATEVPGARVVAVDLAPEAVRLAEANAAAVGAQDVRVVAGDVRDPALLTDLAGRVDVLVSNPPYIPPDAVPREPEVREHDPDLALYGGGHDGLDVPRAVVERAVVLLVPGGLLVMEHAEVQAAAVRDLVAGTGAFDEVRTRPDLAGRDRMVVARRARHPGAGGPA
ncbi:peptide chain release factor N(5)-glutamine methyltransferase [Isoptericola sp. b441]|uniref:Release factor glutamine methyltransferase n=1 Tax=Actinotalea lenta TaxID=3064654 RepID=A0ABT9DD68_9CELL|nr:MULTISPECIES: peptide chain release factor N(5)-glutamine methyltransferase [unclassified Isoptericola]MDO8108279.1 peptide chain release factor N(5)-glutamine methyltransferase [Isoptericola sp. b441]MDO8120047.1 peptide chain release factor N(5)-glutamine methyltransferase [Isoptericola sp. b490]